MSSFAAARSILRSAAGRNAFRKSKTAFCLPKQNQSHGHLILRRSPVEMSRVVGSLCPFHSATASALLISMLSVSHPPSSCWNFEVADD